MNVNNCRCEKKFAKLISIEECDVETDKINNNTKINFLKSNTLIKKIKNCRHFIGISILFFLVSLIFGGIIIYLLKSKNKNFDQFWTNFVFFLKMIFQL